MSDPRPIGVFDSGMTPQDKETTLRLLAQNRIMTVATVRPDGWPQATTVGYASEGLVLYFLCGRQSQKAVNIAADNRISLVIDHDTSDPMGMLIGWSTALIFAFLRRTVPQLEKH